MGHFKKLPGGRDRIRTCEAINLLVFKTSAINHSATLPSSILSYFITFYYKNLKV